MIALSLIKEVTRNIYIIVMLLKGVEGKCKMNLEERETFMSITKVMKFLINFSIKEVTQHKNILLFALTYQKN